jgi:hypothetical protein
MCSLKISINPFLFSLSCDKFGNSFFESFFIHLCPFRWHSFPSLFISYTKFKTLPKIENVGNVAVDPDSGIYMGVWWKGGVLYAQKVTQDGELIGERIPIVNDAIRIESVRIVFVSEKKAFFAVWGELRQDGYWIRGAYLK